MNSRFQMSWTEDLKKSLHAWSRWSGEHTERVAGQRSDAGVWNDCSQRTRRRLPKCWISTCSSGRTDGESCACSKPRHYPSDAPRFGGAATRHLFKLDRCYRSSEAIIS